MIARPIEGDEMVAAVLVLAAHPSKRYRLAAPCHVHSLGPVWKQLVRKYPDD